MKGVRKGAGRTGLALAAVAAVLAVVAPAASASVNLSPGGPFAEVDATTVSGAPPAAFSEATQVAISVCNVETGVTPGTRCDIEGSTPGFVTVAKYAEGVELQVQRGPWQDYTFVKGAPEKVTGSFTTCDNQAGEGDKCAVVVSYYKPAGMGFTQLGAEAKAIVFE